MTAQTDRNYRWLLWLLVVLGFCLDQGSKYLVFKKLYNGGHGGEYVLVPGVFKLLAQYTDVAEEGDSALTSLRTWSGAYRPKVNHGALFGFLNNHITLANCLFAVVSFGAAIAIGFWTTRPSAAQDGILCSALGLILAGTLGNFYDRVIFNGVRDFLYFHWFEFPVFNIADCCLVCGAFLLLTQAFIRQPAPAATPVTEPGGEALVSN